MSETKLPRGWIETHTYRCYERKMGPLVVRLNYSSSSGLFACSITTGGYDYVVLHEIVKSLEPASNMKDAEVMKMMHKRAKDTVRGWIK